jgi:Uma2 family endonuclease
MTAHRRPAHAPAPDLSSEDLLALRRQSPDYVPPPSAPVSWEEFLAWAPDDWRVEWVAGEIIEMPPSEEEHQDTSLFLVTFLLLYIQRHGLGRIFHAPFLMRLPHRPSGREPDLIFVRTEHAERMKWTYVDGPADLVVEIVSPDSATRDYREKLPNMRRQASLSTGLSIHADVRRGSMSLARMANTVWQLSMRTASIPRKSSMAFACEYPGSGNVPCRPSTRLLLISPISAARRASLASRPSSRTTRARTPRSPLPAPACRPRRVDPHDHYVSSPERWSLTSGQPHAIASAVTVPRATRP